MTTELVKKETEANAATAERTRSGLTYTPRVDICENAEELTLFVDMPGVQPDGLDIRFQNRELSIHGRVQPRHQGEYLGCEYGVGDFYRAFAIQEGIEGETINAELKNGVLTVHLPKTQAARPRRIQVKAS
jgi:HSP20 family molecular chaperone IbpA